MRLRLALADEGAAILQPVGGDGAEIGLPRDGQIAVYGQISSDAEVSGDALDPYPGFVDRYRVLTLGPRAGQNRVIGESRHAALRRASDDTKDCLAVVDAELRSAVRTRDRGIARQGNHAIDVQAIRHDIDQPYPIAFEYASAGSRAGLDLDVALDVGGYPSAS